MKSVFLGNEDHAKRLKTFYKEQPSGVMTSFLGACLFLSIYIDSLAKIHLYYLLIHFLISVARLSISPILLRRLDKLNSKPLRDEKIYCALIFANATVWGSTMHLFYSESGGMVNNLVFLFPIAIVVGGVTKMSLSFRASLAYIFGICGAFVLYFIIHWSPLSLIMFIGVFVFSFYMGKTAKSNFTNYVKQIKAIREKNMLLERAKKNLKLERELNHQKSIAHEANRLAALGEMAGGIAHEVNNPLAIIKLKCDTSVKNFHRGKLKMDDVIAGFKLISETVDRISNITQSLLKLSRNPEDIKSDNISVDELLQEVISLTSEKFRSEGINLRYEPKNELIVKANKIAISQVLLNLFNNSIYFIQKHESPWISIDSSLDSRGFVVIKISDSGKPIPKEIQDKLFIPFFSSKPVGEGTGLGLSISKKILNEQGGDLYFQPDDHPCFVINIPAST